MKQAGCFWHAKEIFLPFTEISHLTFRKCWNVWYECVFQNAFCVICSG
jgi:hypothetical protein